MTKQQIVEILDKHTTNDYWNDYITREEYSAIADEILSIPLVPQNKE